MKVVYIGSVLFSAKALEKLISINAEVAGVVTKEHSEFNSDFYDLSSISRANNIPFHYTNNINSTETVDWIRQLEPDVIFCFGWSNLIKKEILQLSRIGVVGFHPTLLPFNRGRHPLIWAKVLGIPKSGSTFFFMDEGADTGDILSQEEFLINFEDDANVLYHKLIDTALKQISVFYFQLKNNTYTRTRQNISLGNTWRKRGKSDGLIDFRMSSIGIANLVRALSKPYVGAHLQYGIEEIKIWKVEPGNINPGSNNLEPGKVLKIDGHKLEIKTGDSSIWLVEHDFKELPPEGSYIG